MSQEKLNHVVMGALIDFVAFLTSREEKIVLSRTHSASPAVEAIEEFLDKHSVESCDPLTGWASRCSRT